MVFLKGLTSGIFKGFDIKDGHLIQIIIFKDFHRVQINKNVYTTVTCTVYLFT